MLKRKESVSARDWRGGNCSLSCSTVVSLQVSPSPPHLLSHRESGRAPRDVHGKRCDAVGRCTLRGTQGSPRRPPRITAPRSPPPTAIRKATILVSRLEPLATADVKAWRHPMPPSFAAAPPDARHSRKGGEADSPAPYRSGPPLIRRAALFLSVRHWPPAAKGGGPGSPPLPEAARMRPRESPAYVGRGGGAGGRGVCVAGPAARA